MVDSGVEPAASNYVTAARTALQANDCRTALAIINGLERTDQPLDFKALQVKLVANEGLLKSAMPPSAEHYHQIVELVREALRLHRAAPLKDADITWLWRLYSRTTLHAIRSCIATGSRLPEMDEEATSRLLASLSASASSGEMPRFDDEGALSGYTTFNLINRAGKVADVLRLCDPQWLRAALELHRRSPRVVMSLGGGPAFDFAAFATLCAFEAMEAGVCEFEAARVHVLDYELGWEGAAEAVSDATRSVLGGGGDGRGSSGVGAAHEMRFGKCDITQSLESASNAAVRSALPESRLLVCSYVICENAKRLRATGYAFFADLMAAAAPGTVLVLTETTHRQFPELIAAARRGVNEGSEGCVLQTALPSIKGKGGSQCILFKRPSSPAGAGESDGGEAKPTRADEVRVSDQQKLLEQFTAQELAHRRSGRVHVEQNRPSRGAY